MDTIVLNTAYFPPVQYMARVKEAARVVVERHDSYGKQGYRNRCEILTANGPLALVVPVRGAAHGERLLTGEARVDYSTRWQRVHARAIEAAYGKSPFYDYYMDEFEGFFRREERFLVDLNAGIMERLMDCLGIARDVSFSDGYAREVAAGVADFRDVFHPKRARRAREDDHVFKVYHQTFNDRFPFVHGLSVLDLLFNVGPDARACL
ncbi:MAG: WbqC family protein [Odoribacteraceae bacterium]|jgi:hypothetical protein|nr:WbqC family protein [Odoribacteraceae bacterium]